MSLLTVIKLSMTFVGRTIFDQIGFQVEVGDRIGLVGPNGSGKTTLLRLLVGEMAPDGGEVRVSKGTRIGYLPQDAQETWTGPLLESILDSIPGRVGKAKELSTVEHALRQIRDREEQSRLAARLAEIHHELDHLETQFPRHEAEKILLGLGFDTADFDRPVSFLSGGWKTRAALAGLLYRKPELLLLDEPTNHLDIPSVRWLEEFLRAYGGAIILVSHDRDFLNRQIRRVISFESEGMRTYSGNYDFYVQAREEENRSLEAQARNQEQKVKEAQKFIERFRTKATKARQAQSKIKLLKKMEMVETHRKEKSLRFSFPPVPRSGRVVLSIKDLSKGFGDKPLYKNVNLTVFRGERVAVIGPNGSGKTTLLRMLAGELRPDQGLVAQGHGVQMSYFAQHHSEMLHPGQSVIQEVYNAAPDATVSFIRGVCGAFLFPGEDVDKKIGVLSGGERARVCLARLLIKPGNLMVMDEPTNHLDLASSEALIDALTSYNGTLMFVSHNQAFVNRLATKIWDVGNGEIVEYPGNLDEYYDHLERTEASSGEEVGGADGAAPTGAAGRPTGNKREDRKASKREEAERRRLVHDTLQPVLERLEALEEGITRLENRQQELERSLADPELFKDKNKSVPLLNEYRDVKQELDRMLSDWEICQGKLETAKRNLGV